ncbi:hypothetical protein HELRODRAFT_179951 [Helobdella robusta]|uniref:Uncharacterized protein n=1 Tax=Helobdella robusta TaxID=6412 RepID=T1FFA1_HELRO|nr:hypothetical protein HELRODRAFT_179951 [Helobdella robusta]ESN94856.1 hypothetical protein HELRODRAFT_179951 [Helobdella robusta]
MEEECSPSETCVTVTERIRFWLSNSLRCEKVPSDMRLCIQDKIDSFEETGSTIPFKFLKNVYSFYTQDESGSVDLPCFLPELKKKVCTFTRYWMVLESFFHNHLKEKGIAHVISVESLHLNPVTAAAVPGNLTITKSNLYFITLYALLSLCIKNPELEARIERLKAEQREKEYKEMVKNVTNKPSINEESIGKQYKQLNRQLITIFNFLLTCMCMFAFAYKATEYAIGPNIAMHVIGGNLFVVFELGTALSVEKIPGRFEATESSTSIVKL